MPAIPVRRDQHTEQFSVTEQKGERDVSQVSLSVRGKMAVFKKVFYPLADSGRFGTDTSTPAKFPLWYGRRSPRSM